MSTLKQDNREPMMIELRRSLSVSRFHVVGEVGFSERRDEIRAIMQLGVERGGRIGANDVSDHLLGGRTPTVGLRLLRLCEELGLVEWDIRARERIAILTDDGREVAVTGDVFVPERGVWDIWVTDDPLVPEQERLLRVEPYAEPRAKDEVYQDSDRDAREIVKLPDWVRDACDVQGVPYFGDGRAVSNIELDENAEEADAGARVTLALRLSLKKSPEVHVRGNVGGRQNAYKLEDVPMPSFDEVWQASLGRHASVWDGRSLGVRFDGQMTDDERRSFVRTMRFSGYTHPEFGNFDGFEVSGVPLRPLTNDDASAWANWRLADGIHGYVHSAEYQRRADELRERFAGYQITLMARAELAAALRARSGERPNRAYWHVMAPLDWGL